MNRQHHKRIEFVTLQENLSQILDDMLKTGDSIEIEHHGRRFQILPLQSETSVESANKLDNLIERPYLQCDPDDIVHVDWSQEWSGDDLS
ncbi:MAG: type II toxin-antitoxin system Phd/YefM family antitoxin [bacterium]|nr:type II toxin-antitoxin system Phd/YefM family antitoxin [bacterium]